MELSHISMEKLKTTINSVNDAQKMFLLKGKFWKYAYHQL